LNSTKDIETDQLRPSQQTTLKTSTTTTTTHQLTHNLKPPRPVIKTKLAL
jgi:hypothetical protein